MSAAVAPIPPGTSSGPLRLCLVRLSALGDVCLVVPLVRELQRSFPLARLTWVIGRESLPVVEGLTGVEYVPFDKRGGWREYQRVGTQLRREPFDALLALQASLRANLLYPWIRATRKIGFDSQRARDGHRWFVTETIAPSRAHFVDAYLAFAQALGCDPGPARWDLPVSAPARAAVRELLASLTGEGPLIVLNPAASKESRNWPVERYVELVRALSTRWRARLVLTGGPAATERQLAEQIQAQLGVGFPVINAVGLTSVPQLFALLTQAADPPVSTKRACQRVASARTNSTYRSTGQLRLSLLAAGFRAISGPSPARGASSSRAAARAGADTGRSQRAGPGSQPNA